jgi:asparagine synthase (glutamine-hydrolysing)
MHRRVNLTGLLQRLDSATMLASVEGRTPFADRVVAELAESLAMDLKFEVADDEGEAGHARPGAALATLRRTMRRTRGRTKVALREAYAGVLPQAVLSRPKASFPLPFQEWMEEPSRVLRRSAFAHEIFNPAAIEAVSARPGALWSMAWPMINVALWAEAMGW